ncbi:MAG: hypothetical protein GY778_16130 [bacterium]|nr:hypothetical protein [bacterium]
MGLSRFELERLADDILHDRAISSDLYCAGCGYNLRSLPYVGRCPECGSEYNGRHIWMESIFTADMLDFPIGDFAAGFLALTFGFWLTASGIHPYVDWRLFFGLAALILGILFARSAWRRTARYLHFRGIAKRIEKDDE